MVAKPHVNSEGNKELERLQTQFEEYKKQVDTLVNEKNIQSAANPHEISQKTIEKSQDIYLKPTKMIMSREKFNEKFREQYNHDKEYVHYTVEHHECRGETVEMWTKSYPGQPAEFWEIPTGKPVWIPRYVANKLEFGCSYRRLKTEDRPVGNDQMGSQYYGTLVKASDEYRISAHPVNTRKNFRMTHNLTFQH